MPFAGDRHVVVTVIAHLAGLPCVPCRDGTGHGQRVALTFLATKAATHAPCFHAHAMHRDTNRLGHFVLYLRRVLRGTHDNHVAALLRECERSLTFKIEVLLTADLKVSFDHMGCFRHGPIQVAATVDPWAVLKAAVGGKSVVDGEEGRCLFDLDARLTRCKTGRQMRSGNHEEKRLPGVVYLIFCQQRFIMNRRRDVVGKRQILCDKNRFDSRGSSDRRETHFGNPPARNRGLAKGEMQRARRCWHVVDIPGRSGDVKLSSVVRQGLCDAHGRTICTDISAP